MALWGRAPTIGEDRWCGAWKMYALDGVADAARRVPDGARRSAKGPNLQGVEAVVQRPDGTRRNVLVYPQRLQGRCRATCTAP